MPTFWSKVMLQTLCLLFTCIVSLNGQPSEAQKDSLERVLDAYGVDSKEGLSASLMLANYYIYSNPNKSSEFSEIVFGHPRKQQLLSPKQYGRHFLVKAWTHQANGQLVEARKYMRKAATVAEDIGDHDFKNEVQLNLFATYNETSGSDLLDELRSLRASVDTSSSSSDRNLWIQTTYLIGRVQWNNDDREEALRTMTGLMESDVMQRADLQARHLAGIQVSTAKYLSEMRNYRWALDYLRGSISKLKAGTNSFHWALHTMARNFAAIGELDSAFHYMNLIPLERASYDDRTSYETTLAELNLKVKDLAAAKRHLAAAYQYGDSIDVSRLSIILAVVDGKIQVEERNFDELEKIVVRIDSMLLDQEEVISTKLQVSIADLRYRAALKDIDPKLVEGYENLMSLNQREINKVSNDKLQLLLLEFEDRKGESAARKTAARLKGEKVTQRWQYLGAILVLSIIGLLAFVYVARQRKVERSRMADKALTIQQELGMVTKQVEIEQEERKRLAQEKTVVESRLAETSEELLKKSAADELVRKILTLPGKNGNVRVPVAEIRYVEAEKDGIRIIWGPTEGESHWVDTPITVAAEEMRENGLVRVHRSFLLNPRRVTRYTTKQAQLEDIEQALSIGRTYKPNFIEAMRAFESNH